MPDINIFYGITTTTIIVLSSATLVVFNHLIDSIKSTAKSCKELIIELDDKERASEVGILEILGTNSVKLSSNHQNISTDIRWAYLVLFLVIFLSAVSIFLTLLSGAFDFSVPIKWIFYINLFSIIIYITAFVGLFWNVRHKKKSLEAITTESGMFIKSIDDTNALYRTLGEKNKEKGNENE